MITRRASHRKFLSEPVSESDITRIVENAIRAPSGHNAQPWRYIAIRDRALITRIADVTLEAQRVHYDRLSEDQVRKLSNFEFYIQHFRDAPLLIAVLSVATEDRSPIEEAGIETATPEHYDPDLLSIGASIQNCLLTVEALGYGACWLTAPIRLAQKALGATLDVAEGRHLVSLIAVGRPTKERRPATKRDVAELLTFR